MAATTKRKRKPMTEEQRVAAAERLAKARAAKAPSEQVSLHESIRNLDDDHPLHPVKVKSWLKEWKNHANAIKALRLSNDPKERRQYYEAKNYIHNMQTYLSSGAWLDTHYGENRENKYTPICIALAYDKNGNVKRTDGVFYPDLGLIWKS